MIVALISTIAAAGFALTVLFLAYGRPDDDRGGARAEMVRYFGMAGVAALLCGALNVAEGAGGGTAAAAGGNATNVMAVGVLWAGMRRLNHRGRVGAIGIVAVSLFLLGLTFLVPLENATLAKIAGLAVFAALAAFESTRRSIGSLRGSGLLTWTLGAYSAYNASRLVVVAAVGTDPLSQPGAVSAETTALVSAAAIVLVAIGTALIGRQLDDRPSPGTPAHDRGALRRQAARVIATYGTARVTLVRLPELDLIRTAHSIARGQEVLRAAVGAVDDAVPGVVAGLPSRDTVFAVAPAEMDGDDVEAGVRSAFARRMPMLNYDDVPDLTFEHSVIRSVDGLSVLMKKSRIRSRGRFVDGAR